MTKQIHIRMPFPFPSKIASGMTLRDYFAANALNGLLQDDVVEFAEVASDAYRLADAMIEARE